MRSRCLTLVLAAAVAFAGLPASTQAGEAGNVAEQMAKAMPDAPDDAAHKLHYVLEGIEGVEVGLGILEATGVVALGFEILGPLAATAALWIALGNAHAEAINSVTKDQMLSGFSHGVVLGADDRPADYVKWNFVKRAPVPNAVYPEYGTKFQNAYNQALAAGYAQGRRLLESKTQRAAFFEDLYSRMSTHPSISHGDDQSVWSDRTWVDHYIECAAMFRKDHLK